MPSADVLTKFRKRLADRRQELLEQFTKVLSPEGYQRQCGRIHEVEELTNTLQDLIRKSNRAETATDEDE